MSQKYGVNELRKMFLDFFESKGHLIMKSFSLVPHNDNSLLLINAGMAPLKPYFTGQEIPPRKRVATCQKCIRTGDIENVGKTARHGTFFEMLGNFSFGDYFKKEAIQWTWEFLTDTVGLDPDRLYPSVYLDDDEAFDIWNKEIGIAKERIFRFGKEDNFWEHGSGPCGPCSEVYYDRGEKYGCGKKTCTVGCDCDRYMEVWNDVFTQFDNDGNGHYTELQNKNIDTGMGLERLAVVVQDVDSIFEVDTIRNLLEKVADIANTRYKDNEKHDISLRLITDHVRSCTFMISDGIMPSNEGRGYVLRRLLRRAARHGRILGIKGTFLAELSKTVIEDSKDGYPELEEKRAMILKVITEEEEKFNRTIDQGLLILSQFEEKMEKNHETVLAGEDAFKLYDTYGFPLDLTKEILEEKGMSPDEKCFDKCMQDQKDKARKARKKTNYMGADVNVYQSLDPGLVTEFTGYDSMLGKGMITAMTTENDVVEALADGDRGTIVTDSSPFYATMGGQMGDTGLISASNGTFCVEDTIKLPGEKTGHVGHMMNGMLTFGENVTLKVDEKKRTGTEKNHSATHLLQKALRLVLGDHVEQSGSYVNDSRLRFDFTHFAPMTADEIKKVEETVNKEIEAALPVETRIMSLEDAKKSGAMALFGEKYHDNVRVVSMGDFSKELCGGTHVKNTGNIGAFKIISETGIAAGVRRIEALTGDGLMKYYDDNVHRIHDVCEVLKTTPEKLSEKCRSLLEEIHNLKSENDKLKSNAAMDAVSDSEQSIEDVKGVRLLTAKVDGVEMNELRGIADKLKTKTDDGVVVLASVANGKVNLLVMAADKAQKAGAHAGNIIKAIAGYIGGGGGGRPNMAQAGGKDASGVDKAFEAAKDALATQLK